MFLGTAVYQDESGRLYDDTGYCIAGRSRQGTYVGGPSGTWIYFQGNSIYSIDPRMPPPTNDSAFRAPQGLPLLPDHLKR